MRPGRLDRQVFVGPPDFEGRVEILRIRTQKMSVEAGLDIAEIARMVRLTWCSPHELCTDMGGADRGLLWRGARCALPRGSDADYERELPG
jgi:SpoVK/Ycf46/Vps4 family AAA+-type ATPase